MSAYQRELFGLPLDTADLRRWTAPPKLPETVLHCAGCRARVTLVGVGADVLRQQLRLYHHGWRRDPDPDPPRDYCPPCAVSRGLDRA